MTIRGLAVEIFNAIWHIVMENVILAGKPFGEGFEYYLNTHLESHYRHEDAETLGMACIEVRKFAEMLMPEGYNPRTGEWEEEDE